MGSRLGGDQFWTKRFWEKGVPLFSHTHMEGFDELARVMFFPRKFVPPTYDVVREEGKQEVLFTFCMHRCRTKTKNTIVFFHGNGEIVEVCACWRPFGN